MNLTNNKLLSIPRRGRRQPPNDNPTTTNRPAFDVIFQDRHGYGQHSVYPHIPYYKTLHHINNNNNNNNQIHAIDPDTWANLWTDLSGLDERKSATSCQNMLLLLLVLPAMGALHMAASVVHDDGTSTFQTVLLLMHLGYFVIPIALMGLFALRVHRQTQDFGNQMELILDRHQDAFRRDGYWIRYYEEDLNQFITAAGEVPSVGIVEFIPIPPDYKPPDAVV